MTLKDFYFSCVMWMHIHNILKNKIKMDLLVHLFVLAQQ